MPKTMTAFPLLLVLLGPGFLADAADAPSAESLIAALMAQEQSIASYSCSWNEQRFEVDSSGIETKVAEYDKLMRWTREAAYAQQDEVHFDHMLGRLLRSFYTDTQAAADSSQWSKTFDSRGIGTDFMHHGEISPPGPANTLAPYERSADSHAPSVVHLMYEYLRPEYAKYFLDGTAEVITRDDGYIELRSAPTNASGSVYVYTLDPNKGFAPVKTGDTGTYSVQRTFSEHVKIQGIWIPMLSRTVSEDINGGDKRIVTKTVSVFQLNVDFRPEDLDIIFPDGTVVKDHIAGRDYTVGQTTAGEQQDAAEMIPKAVANNNDRIAVSVKPETVRSSEPLVGNAKAIIEQQTGALRLAWLALALGIVFALALVVIAAFVVRRRLLHKQISGAHRAYLGQATTRKGVTISHLK